MKLRVWSCKIGYAEDSCLAPGSDGPMRDAVESAFKQVTGGDSEFMFSGWDGQLSPGELAVINDTDPPRWPSEVVDMLTNLANEYGKALVADIAQSMWLVDFMPRAPESVD